jgi:hypothetical protein
MPKVLLFVRPTGGGGGGGGDTDPYGEYVSLLMHFDPDVSVFPEGAIGFWKLSDLTDISGNSNTLTNTGSAQFVSGKIGNCAQFNGSNYLGVASGLSPVLNPSGTFSVSFWAYPTQLYNYCAFVSGGSSGSLGFNIHSEFSGQLYFNNAQAADCSVPDLFANNVWHHVVCMKDGANNKLIVYKNGEKVYDQPASQTYGTSWDKITIGGYRYPGSQSNAQPQIGLIDAVGVWNRVLTEAEITTLYNNGNGLEP